MTLLDTLSARLRPDKPAAPAELPAPDARLAMAALLVRMAKADRAYLFAELQQIDRVLAAQNDLNPVEAARMRASAERLEAALPNAPTFARVIRDACPYAERLRLIEALWSVILADGLKQSQELDAITLMERDLEISPEDAARLRFRPDTHGDETT